MRKRIFAVILCICIFTGTADEKLYAADFSGDFAASAGKFPVGMDSVGQESSEEEAVDAETGGAEFLDDIGRDFLAGLLPEQVLDAGEVKAEEIFSKEADGSKLLKSSVYASEWDSCSSNYIYNFLSEEERAYWDQLDAICLRLLLGTENTVGGMNRMRTQFALSGNLSEREVMVLSRLFRHSNPQYYFLNATTWLGNHGGAQCLALGIYTEFGNGEDRQVATQLVKAQIDDWIAIVNTYGTQGEKVKAIHDLIARKVSYNADIYNALFDEESSFTQSAYSVFCMDRSVCAGYSLAFEAICNAVGIDCIAVTSAEHEWNKVRIDDSWYNVDCTWDNQPQVLCYTYFGRSDAQYSQDTAHNVAGHTAEVMWTKYLPPCTLDTRAFYMDSGRFPTITNKTEAPEIIVSPDKGGYRVSLVGKTPGSVLYYTLDGQEPTPSYTKCYKYNEDFTVESNCTVKAVAVCDTYWDSSVVARSVKDGTVTPLTGKAKFVALLYESALGRSPVQSEIDYWAQELSNGRTGADTAYGFLFSLEFRNKNYSNPDYVEHLYASLMGRPSDEGGKQGWVTCLDDGVSRGYIFKQFINSKEFANLCAEYGIQQGSVTLTEQRDRNYNVTRFVARNYRQFLGRDYEADGLNYWSELINNGTKPMHEIAFGFVFSPECMNKNLSNGEFAAMMYRGCFDREGEQSGIDYWVKKLESGELNRTEVFYGFANSQEFANMVNSYGL